jgi:hypothetical protein
LECEKRTEERRRVIVVGVGVEEIREDISETSIIE